MLELKNDRFIKALLRQPVDATPVWIMRQAGRYLPEYRAVRAQAGDFLTLCKTPELACEVTLQPLRRYDLDAAIIFSDILTIPDAMGLGLYFVEGEGPCFQAPLRTDTAIKQLRIPEPEQDLAYVMDAIRLCRTELNGKVPLIGFAGSPWTLACYMVEGGPSKEFSWIKKLIYQEPNLALQLLDKLADTITAYLNAQIKAGAQAIMLFDTWGGILTSRDYELFSLAPITKIMQGLIRQYNDQIIPTILFTKGGGQWLEKMLVTGCDALGLDWTIEIKEARARVGQSVALQGNMDPLLLCTTPERIRTEVATILADYGVGNGHVFNLGHGILQHALPENVQVLVEAVHEFSRPYHQAMR